jgi:hypothetical protein
MRIARGDFELRRALSARESVEHHEHDREDESERRTEQQRHPAVRVDGRARQARLGKSHGERGGGHGRTLGGGCGCCLAQALVFTFDLGCNLRLRRFPLDTATEQHVDFVEPSAEQPGVVSFTGRLGIGIVRRARLRLLRPEEA